MLQVKNHIISEILHLGSLFLKEKKIETHSIDARILLGYVLKMSHEELIMNSNDNVNQSNIIQYEHLIRRRIDFEPIAYIIGKKEFFGLEFTISTDVLIPRSDSETLIDSILRKTDKNKPIKILDLGTGSGCLAITLAKMLPNSFVTAVDISNKALDVAKNNADNLGVMDRIDFKHSNWFDNLEKSKFDIIISNPPYIRLEDVNLMNNETKFEPYDALFAEEDGMINYSIICKNAHKFMHCETIIYFEFGIGDHNKVKNILQENGFHFIKFEQDLSGITRIAIAKSSS